jgi:hypothetical protein
MRPSLRKERWKGHVIRWHLQCHWSALRGTGTLDQWSRVQIPRRGRHYVSTSWGHKPNRLFSDKSSAWRNLVTTVLPSLASIIQLTFQEFFTHVNTSYLQRQWVLSRVIPSDISWIVKRESLSKSAVTRKNRFAQGGEMIHSVWSREIRETWRNRALQSPDLTRIPMGWRIERKPLMAIAP